MDIGVPIRNFGKVNMQALGAAVLAQDETAWNENVQRQKDYEVHEQTRSIVLLFANVEDWPAIEVSKQPGWDRLADAAVPVMHEIVGKYYPPGGTIIRANRSPTTPPPTIAMRSAGPGAASHTALSAVSRFAAKIARSGGTPSGSGTSALSGTRYAV